MPFLSLTTWSLHRNLGPLRWTAWDDSAGTHVTHIEQQPEKIALTELPSILALKGYVSADVCHFHIPDRSEAYLQQLRQSFADAGIRFYTLLLDYGDISSADENRRNADIQWMKEWIEHASIAGAERVRIIAGAADPADKDALVRSANALRELADYAAAREVKVVTENFYPLASNGDNCLYLLDACGRDKIGLVSDFGNLTGPSKYDELSKIVPVSDNIHAKAAHNEHGELDSEEFARCLDIVQASGYEGPITIVYDGPGDMWEGIERTRIEIEPYLGSK